MEVRSVRNLDSKIGWSRALGDSNVIEFNKRPAWRRPLILLPWAVAATIALAASYQSLVVVPGLRQAVSPQPLSPVMLREATRGALPVINVRGTAFRHARR